MDKKTQGAWIVHHGKKIHGTANAAANYPTLDIAGKAGSLLARMARTNETTLNADLVKTLGQVGGLSHLTDLPACLRLLEQQKVIDCASNGGVTVIGVSASSALDHTADLFAANDPSPFENAALELGEMVSEAPVSQKLAAEKIGDDFKLSSRETEDFLVQASAVGFVEADGDGSDPLLFNGNLFRRENIAKTQRVLDSLLPQEQTSLAEFEAKLKARGAIQISEAERILGAALLAKLRVAAVFDENIVSNEAGDHSFITSPGAFHKFSNPLVDDAFDHAKALVAALSYGMHVSSRDRGNIWGVDKLLNALLRGKAVGPKPAIGKDYRALELEQVVEIIESGSNYYLRLLKMEVGEIALQVLKHGSAASANVIDEIPGAQVTNYVGPERARSIFKSKPDLQPSKSQMRGLLSAVRSGGGL